LQFREWKCVLTFISSLSQDCKDVATLAKALAGKGRGKLKGALVGKKAEDTVHVLKLFAAAMWKADN
jgi:hypothetical protein